MRAGHRCGYVRIPENHPWHGKSCGDIPVECHGGLTFSKEFLTEEIGFAPGHWIGFDCAHLGDCPDTEAADRAFGDSSEAHLTGFFSYGGAIRSALFVEKECLGIIDQLVEKEKEGNKK